MKRMLLLSATLFFVTICSAQLKRTNQIQPGNGDTTWHNLTWPFKSTKVTTGNVKLLTEPGKFDLYVSYKMKKVTGYYAIDNAGNKISVVYTYKNRMPKLRCNICITKGENKVCYYVDCSKMPPPKSSNATEKVAN